MSEKRFEVINARWQGKGEAVAFEDTQTNQVYFAENQEECKRIVELLNSLNDENEELLQFKKKVKKELQSRYDLSNHKPVFKAMAKELELELV